MNQMYYEVRNLPTNPPATLAADISRHLQTRQYLGNTLVVCDNAHAILSATRKQWLKATRYLQRQRASTLNAEEILRLTHVIMHMQNMLFVPKNPNEHPEGSVFFAETSQPIIVPPQCLTVYVTAPLSADAAKHICSKLPQHSLVVSYVPQTDWAALGLQPKASLEERVLDTWRSLTHFLTQHGISAEQLVLGNSLQFGAMDTALDILLGVSMEFLRESTAFQQAINLAQPFNTIAGPQQKTFEAVTRLAHRVQALTPGSFNGFLGDTFSDIGSDMFFLRDISSELYMDLEIEAATPVAKP